MLNRQGLYVIEIPPPPPVTAKHVCRHWRATNLQDWDEDLLTAPEYKCVECGKLWTAK